MPLRDQAREFAENAVRSAGAQVVGLIERRVEWRRANSHRLALEAQYMVDNLPGWRRLAIAIWKVRARKWASRAWADDQLLAAACGVRQT